MSHQSLAQLDARCTVTFALTTNFVSFAQHRIMLTRIDASLIVAHNFGTASMQGLAIIAQCVMDRLRSSVRDLQTRFALQWQ
jgi:hypothetical protein